MWGCKATVRSTLRAMGSHQRALNKAGHSQLHVWKILHCRAKCSHTDRNGGMGCRMKGAAVAMEKSSWSGPSTEADRGLAHPIPELTLKMRGRSLDWAWITSGARTGAAENWGSLGGSQSRSEVCRPQPPPRPPGPCPQLQPGTHLRSRACRRAPLAGLSFGSGASKSSRRESLRAANTRCQPRRTPEGRGTWGKAGRHEGPTRPRPPACPPAPPPAPAHRQEALVGGARARFGVHSQGCVEEVRGHRAGGGLWGTSRVTEVAADCGESRRRREAGGGPPGSGDPGQPQPSAPQAVTAPSRRQFPVKGEKKKKTEQQWEMLMRRGGRLVQQDGGRSPFPTPGGCGWHRGGR